MKKLIFFLSLSFSSIYMFAQNLPAYVPANGLISWWPFSGNAVDSSGNGNNGTVNGATLTTDRFGNANSAYNFNSSNNCYIQSTIGIFDTITISAWFKCGPPQTYYGMIFSYGDASVNGATYSGQIMGPFSGWVSAGHLGKFHPYAYTSGYLSEIIPNQASDNNLWHNVVVTYVPNDRIYLYIDGLFVSSSPLNYFPIIQGVLSFGRDLNNNAGNTNNQGKYDGQLDDIGIWNRILTNMEITELYNSCLLTINTQPTSQITNFNDNAEYVVRSSATNATYQWQTDLGFGFVNLSNSGQYSGVNNDTLIVSNVVNANNNQAFRCILIDGSCTDTSNIALLTICAGISIQPQNQNANLGNSALFISSSNNNSAVYQWQTDLGFGFVNLSNNVQYSGVTNDSLTVSNLSLTNNNQLFRCIISAGSCIDTSDVALLSVINSTNISQLNNNSIKIYPNPASKFIKIEYTEFDILLGYTVRISNISGQIIYNQNINKQLIQIDLTGFSEKGAYLVEILNNEGRQLAYKKIVLQ